MGDSEDTFISIVERESSNLQRLKHVSYSVPVISVNQSADADNSGKVLRRKLLAAGTRQKKFCSYFKPLRDPLLDYFACAWTAEGLYQGHLYITQDHFAFYSHVLGFTKKVLIPVKDIVAIEKEYTAKFIPNAISISVTEKKHFFASFISRDSAHKVLYEVWEEKVGPRNNNNNQNDENNENEAPSSTIAGKQQHNLRVEASFGINSETGSGSASDSAEPGSTQVWTTTPATSIDDPALNTGSESTNYPRLRPKLRRMQRISIVSIRDACERRLVNPVKQNSGLLTKWLLSLIVLALLVSSIVLSIKIFRLQASTGSIYSYREYIDKDFIEYKSRNEASTKSMEEMLQTVNENLQKVKVVGQQLETLLSSVNAE